MRISNFNNYLCVASFLLRREGRAGSYCPTLQEETILRPFPFCLSFHRTFYKQRDSTLCRVAKYGYRFSEISFSIWGHIYFYFRSEEHTSELQSRPHLVCRLLLEKKKTLHITT